MTDAGTASPSLAHAVAADLAARANSAFPVTPARLVRDQHVGLYLKHAQPNDDLRYFYDGFLKDVRRKAGRDSFRGRDQLMFYPINLWDKNAYLYFSALVASQLRDARTYQVTADLCDAVLGMYANTRNRLQKIQSEEIVSPAGFVWLDKPWLHTDIWGKTIAVRAVSWSPQPVRYQVPEDPDTNPWVAGQPGEQYDVDGTRICHWSYRHDADDYTADRRKGRRLNELYGTLGDLILLHSYVWPHQMRFDGDPETNPSQGEPAVPDHPMAWLRCLWLMLDSEITATRQEHPAHKRNGKRAQRRTIRHDDVTVVTLRRIKLAELDGHDYGTKEIDWTCRWMVQGFWRHLDGQGGFAPHRAHPAHWVSRDEYPLCATCGSRVTWVKPHVGNAKREDLPLRINDKVYRLAR